MSNFFEFPDVLHAVGDYTTLSQTQQWGINDLKIPEAWKKAQGEYIEVAVLDTGACKHSDVLANILIDKSRSFIDDEDIYDNYVGHGCHVSGLIASLNNEFGVVGIAPKSKIVSIKVLDKNGFSSNNSILKGLDYCIQIKPDVVNLSLGGSKPMEEVRDRIKTLTQMGIPVVVSAGNSGATPSPGVLYPGKYPESITVGSYSPSTLRGRSLFSSYGPELNFSAPGEQILSTFLNEQYAVMSGTSQAAPQVTGIIALFLSYLKAQQRAPMTVEQIKNELIKHCTKDGKPVFNSEFGWGIINVVSLFQDEAGNIIPAAQISTTTKPTFWQKIKSWFK